MHISYGLSEDAWLGMRRFIENLIRERKVHRILELGAGATPAFPIEFIQQNGLEYTLLDISAVELAKAPQGYKIICADIADPDLRLNKCFDMVISCMLAEHVKNGEAFHSNVFRLLARGGTAFHFFPTFYALPFVVNRFLPERIAEVVLHLLQSGRESNGRHGKFPAYYSWCRGPIRSQVRCFERLGFTVEKFIGFYGHASYYERLPIIKKTHQAFSHWLVKHPIPWLCSFSYVILIKPMETAGMDIAHPFNNAR